MKGILKWVRMRIIFSMSVWWFDYFYGGGSYEGCSIFEIAGYR
jgi:hypothetical protein